MKYLKGVIFYLGMFFFLGGLKLGGVVDFSWFVVSMPLWLPWVALAIYTVVLLAVDVSNIEKARKVEYQRMKDMLKTEVNDVRK